MNTLIFKLSELEVIKFITNNSINFRKIDFYCDEVKVYFVNQQRLCIGQQTVGVVFESFITKLKNAMNNQLQLDESLTQNLGFMYNEYCYEFPNLNPEFIMVPRSDGSSRYWIGSNYEIWCTYNGTNPMVTTWMYNDAKGQIIFEVTPLYKWSFLPDNLEDPEFITYEEFMKDYKPLIHRVIPREVAIEWLEQAMKFYRGLFSSKEKYIAACKENNW